MPPRLPSEQICFGYALVQCIHLRRRCLLHALTLASLAARPALPLRSGCDIQLMLLQFSLLLTARAVGIAHYGASSLGRIERPHFHSHARAATTIAAGVGCSCGTAGTCPNNVSFAAAPQSALSLGSWVAPWLHGERRKHRPAPMSQVHWHGLQGAVLLISALPPVIAPWQ
jgi:hypothetical protein